MADGRVVIDVVVNDEQLKKLDGSLGTVEKSTGKVATGAKNMTVAMLAVKAVSKVFDAVSQSLDAAISRFDTMKQYPRVMEMIGFSTEQSERSVQKLSDGIQGLPTRLDEVVSTAQGLAVMSGDINKATDLTPALNNAFCKWCKFSRCRTWFSSISTDASRVVDMQSWHTRNNARHLEELLKPSDMLGCNSDFYKALQDGEITFDQFGDKLIELTMRQRLLIWL